MPEMFTAVQDRVRQALSLDEKASAQWEALHTSASTSEVLAAGGRYVCTMRRDAPEDLAFILEARKLLPLLATDCQTLVAELGRLLEARDKRAEEQAEADRASAVAAERDELLARLRGVEAERDALRAEAEANGPWDQNPVVWERFCKAAADWDPRASCAATGCGAVTWLAFRATYCRLHRRPADAPGSDWLPDRRPYPLPERVLKEGDCLGGPVGTAGQGEQKVLGYIDPQGIPRVAKPRDPA